MDIKAKLLDYLKGKRLMIIATVSEAGPWICSVYYAIDDQFNLYFISSPTAKHVADLERNNKVAIAVTDTTQKFEMQKRGAQMIGTAEKLVSGSDEYAAAIKLWTETVWGYHDNRIFEQPGVKSMAGLLYRVKINHAKYLDEIDFGEHVAKDIDL